MTLDEAINLYEKRTEELYKAIPCDGCPFDKCKEEHRQLAEWLRELQELRREYTCKECRYSSYGFSDHPCSVCRRGYYPRHSMTDYYEMEVEE